MDFGLLLVPFFTGLAAFSLAVFNNLEAVNIGSLNVPGAVSGSSGFTSDVLIKRMVDRMQQIEAEAQSRADSKQVIAQDDGGAAAVLGDFFQLTPLLRVVQSSLGLIPYTLSGEILVRDKELEMVLRGSDSKNHLTMIRARAPSGDVRGLIDKAAYESMRMIDPVLLASYQFKRDYLTRDFILTQDVIRQALTSEDVKSHKWVLNLWGVVQYQESDFNGAIDKFRRALEVDPYYTSPMLNWGVVLARQGNHVGAIEKFLQLTKVWRRGDHVDTLAAAYCEWGFSLALLGKTEEAFAKFRKAVEVDPTFSDTYSSWAEVLSAVGRTDEAQRMTEEALKLSPVDKVYTDNLVGRIQRLPAVASSH